MMWIDGSRYGKIDWVVDMYTRLLIFIISFDIVSIRLPDSL